MTSGHHYAEQQFKEQLARSAFLVEQKLGSLLGDAAQLGEFARPLRLMAAMRHAVLGGGKRLRPFLVMNVASSCGVAAHKALDAACAVELVHCYSLVHDDLPAMDDDDLRRGHPTVHKAFDEATAILAGDGLLTLAFEVIAAPSTHADPAIRADMVVILARAAGLGGMVGGQMLDLEAEGRFDNHKPKRLSQPAIRQLQAMKTGALICASVMMGACVAAVTPKQVAALKDYGNSLGAAFQIADDILDVESSKAAMGKATSKDAAKGKGTLVNLIGLEAAKLERDRLVEAATASLQEFGNTADMLRQAALFAAQRKS